MAMDNRYLTSIRAVVFDAVGTLIHPEPGAAEVYAMIGHRFDSQLSVAEIGPRFRAAFTREEEFDRRHGYQTSAAREVARWRRIVATVLDDVADAEGCFRTLFAHFARPDAWRCDPDAAAVIEGLLQRGYRLGLASNYDGRLRTVVAGLPPLDQLPHLVISSEVGWRKPAAAFFAAVCRAVGLPPEEVLYVGDDRVNDYEGAAAAELRPLLFDPRERAADTAIARVAKLMELTSPAET
jgi:putative hydrolase of the HAD superfamily